MLRASVIVVGDEILDGYVEDTNSRWLARRLREAGVALRRIVTVPDEVDVVAGAVRGELERARPRLVITTGGIGSTPDDVTYEAVAVALDRELVAHPLLSERVEGALTWTGSHGVEVDGEMRHHMHRMARVPAGATLLAEETRWSPGVRVDVDGGVDAPAGATLAVLPGVPGQLRDIYREAVHPRLVAGRGEPPAVAEVTHGFPESALNPCFAALVEHYPELKVGSYPGVPMMVRLRGRAGDVAAARAELERYLSDLEGDPAGARLRRGWMARLDSAGGEGA